MADEQEEATPVNRAWLEEQQGTPSPVETAPAEFEAEDDEPTIGGTLYFIAENCDLMRDRLEQLTNLVNEGNAAAERREEIVNKLHQENQRLRAGEIRDAVEPVLRDLIRLYDDLERSARAWSAKPGFERPATDFGIFADLAADILARYGVERFTADPGTPFQNKEQRVIKAVASARPEDNGKIESVLHSGFRSGDRIIRSLEVQVYRYVEPKSEAAKTN
jgi:molecular chaperone GrpE